MSDHVDLWVRTLDAYRRDRRAGLRGRRLQWFIRSECRGCGLKVGVDVPAGQMNGLVDRMMWTDEALHRLERMPPYLAPLVRGGDRAGYPCARRTCRDL